MNYETKNKIQAILSPYNKKKRKQTITAVFNSRLHFVTDFSFDCNSHKMKLRLKECGPQESSTFTIAEDEKLLKQIIFHTV
jgi:hypothetical protein